MQIFHALTWRRKTTTAAAEEDVRGRCEYVGDEVEAVKLFLTGDDGSSGGARF